MSFLPHGMAFRQALHRLAGKPLSTLLSALVVAIALTLPALSYVLIDNLASLANGVTGKPEISVFLKKEVTAEKAQAMENRLRADKRIVAIRFIGRDTALKQLAARGGFADVTGALSENPLPDAFILEPGGEDPKVFEAIRTSLTAMPEVLHVQLDSAWVERLHAAVELGRWVALLLAALLGTALIIVTFNTIRLQILTQRHEITVSLLLGATRAFVRRPFLYFGLLQGLLGGVLAWGMVQGLVLLIAPRVQALARAYNIVVDLAGPSVWQGLALLVFAAVLGWLGAGLSVRRHLHDGAVD
ncbi:permease-like cell division protein FtsX [Uliginosibacterium sp. 31-16]|uniref:permease-like cell division protein FtsX n=1 Tax=Uliginosibacterium sp. 31-16 TaxID=3068315 RepID=UPI00273F6DE0|nr:permease-like cell division protein FtsX [Uliginosibacterium sp. 31-16]MDP5241166.1 permease-like cell division protein FtsX [Uliginosibacterium sp. 31-16]